MVKDAAPAENLHASQHSSKKHLSVDSASRPKHVPAGLLQDKGDSGSRTSSRTGSRVSSPSLPGLDVSPLSNNSSLDQSEKLQLQLPAHVSESKGGDRVLPEPRGAAVYSVSDGSCLDDNQKQRTLPLIGNDTTASFSHSLSNAVSTENFGNTSGKPDDHSHSTFAAHSSQAVTVTVGKQPAAVSASQELHVKNQNEALTPQAKDTKEPTAQCHQQQTDSTQFHQYLDSSLFHQQLDNSRFHQPLDTSQFHQHQTSDSTQFHQQSDASKFHEQSDSHSHFIPPLPTNSNSACLNRDQETTPGGQLDISQGLNFVDSTHEPYVSAVCSAPNHGQQLKTLADLQPVSHPSPSSFPSSISAVENRNHLPGLQSTMQNLFHQSSSLSSPSPQWLNGSDEKVAAHTSTVPQLPAPNTLLDDKHQGTNPSLMTDFHCRGTSPMSETADMISGNDVSLSKQPSLPSTPVPAAKKPKKKRAPSKPPLHNSVFGDMPSPSSSSFLSQKTAKKQSPVKSVSSESPPFSASSLSGGVTPVGTLPPFGAFAGMKLDSAHSSVGHISNGSQSQCVNFVNFKQGTEPQAQTVNFKQGTEPQAQTNTPLDQTLFTRNEYSDIPFMEVNKPQEFVGDISSALSDVIESDNNHENIKQEVNFNAGCGLPNNNSVNGVRAMHGKCVDLSANDVGSVRPYPEQQFRFQASSGEVIHPRPSADNPAISPRQGSTLNNRTDLSPLGDETRLDFKPAFGNSIHTSLNIPVTHHNSASQDRTLYDSTLHDSYLAHGQAAALGSDTMLNTANSSRVKPLDSSGMTPPPTHNNMKMPLTASPQGNLVKSGPAQDFVSNYNTQGSTPSFQSKTPAWGLSPTASDKGSFSAPYENGKWLPQEKSPGRKCASQENTPTLINGWNGKPSTEPQTWKKENGAFGKSVGSTSVLSGRASKTNSGSVAKKAKPNVGLVKNGSFPGLKREFQATTRPPSTPEPKVESGFVPKSPVEELDDRLRNNRVETVPQCSCLGPNYEFNESMEGPFYSQLGVAKDMASLRRMMEERTGLTGKAIRLEKVHYTGKEGRTQEGCPIAKWIIRRSGPEEKYLCVARKRPGHFCEAAYIVMVIVAWEGVASSQADTLYGYLVSTLTKYGFETERRCGTNESKTCACQGVDMIRRGASFSFGCSWSMYFNRCKYARSNVIRKFKLKDTNEEEKIEEHLQDLATKVAPLYKVVAPDAYRNQTYFEETASMCRLGKEKGKPFSGVTACMDFCAHSHKDFHNMQNGSTVVVTLTKNRGFSKPDDEQLHVLPLYVLDNTDEHGSVDGQMQKVQAGALEILHKYSYQARLRATPLKKPRRGAKKNSPAKASTGVNTPSPNSSGGGRGSSAPTTPVPPGTPTTPTPESDSSFLNSQDSNQSFTDGSVSGNNSSAMQSPDKKLDGSPSLFVDRENSSNSDDMMMSQRFGPSEMYEKVWEYFYAHGVFPPPSYMDRWAAAQKQAMMNSSSADRTNTGANSHGSNNLHSPHHQPPSHQHPFQAADIQQNHSSSGAQHSFQSGCPPFPPGHRTEAASPADVDQEIVHLTEAVGRNSGNMKSSSYQGPPSRPQSVNAGEAGPPGSRRPSSLDLLTECAAILEPGKLGNMSPSMPSCPSHPFSSTPVNSHSRPASRSSLPPFSPGECNHFPPEMMSPTLPRPHSNPGVHNNHHFGSPFMSPKPSCDGTSAPPSCNDNQTNCSTQSKPVMQSGSFVAPTLGQGPDEPTFTMIDPTVVKCEWKDNTENFHDPGIGGVAIALSHGAVLFEVAKRELHATTALKNPNRYQPTRISLVFYQHKNLNYFHHGYYEYERQLAAKREDRIRKLMEEGQTAEEAEKAVKPGRKRKKKAEGVEEEEEKIDFAKTSAAQYKYMWDTTVRHGVSLTTDSIITRWIDPQPMVTGPYQRWV
ncbi:uncharacterized protein LOC143291927 [Babylonia areolata]|uniref:uncharacterized protein LOC143291927 n=1 Tax=Babylonia areolata TaxID=304850 RepID=UPI003FD5B8C2